MENKELAKEEWEIPAFLKKVKLEELEKEEQRLKEEMAIKTSHLEQQQLNKNVNGIILVFLFVIVAVLFLIFK